MPEIDSKTLHVLLIEDNVVEARMLGLDFGRLKSAEFELVAVERLSEAAALLLHNRFDVVLLDLFLEDSSGLETLSKVRAVAPDTPIVVLTALDDEAQALQALKQGAQDYLIKGKLGSSLLFRAIRYAIERKQIEQRLLQSQKLEALGTLANGVAHNFNNMLAVILGNCDLMLEQIPLNDENRPHIDTVKKVGQRAALLTRQLFMFSSKQRAGAETEDLNRIVLDMNVLLESMLNSKVRLELKLASEPVPARADSGQVQQMIMSLVLNARDAMPNGGDLIIETGTRDDQAVLRVSDTGCGMSPEISARIFEPFFTTKGLLNASGLGLSTVYGMVQQNGGNIEVVSKPDVGTTFVIAFPAGTREAGCKEFDPCDLRLSMLR